MLGAYKGSGWLNCFGAQGLCRCLSAPSCRPGSCEEPGTNLGSRPGRRTPFVLTLLSAACSLFLPAGAD